MGRFLHGVLSLIVVSAGFGLLVLLNGLWLYPLVLSTVGRRSAEAMLPLLILTPFLLALGEIVTLEVVRAWPRPNWEGFPAPALPMAGGTPGAKGLFRRRWRSPDGTAEALLVVARDRPGGENVRINFRAADAVLATLVGQPVWLAGCPTAILPDGNADVPRADLLAARAQGRPLDLCVGPQHQSWRLTRRNGRRG